MPPDATALSAALRRGAAVLLVWCGAALAAAPAIGGHAAAPATGGHAAAPATEGQAAAPAPDGPAALRWTHAHAAFGEPKHAAGFSHFDYANPDAPRGGTLNLRNPDRRSSFDKFNPFTTKGNAPAGLGIFMFESLTVPGSDELQTMYGLLAEAIAVALASGSLTRAP